MSQINDMSVFGVGVGGQFSHNGVDNAKRRSLFCFELRVLGDIGLTLMREASVLSSVGMVVWRIYWVGEAIQ